jgi:hypothetical protein
MQHPERGRMGESLVLGGKRQDALRSPDTASLRLWSKSSMSEMYLSVMVNRFHSIPEL